MVAVQLLHTVGQLWPLREFEVSRPLLGRGRSGRGIKYLRSACTIHEFGWRQKGERQVIPDEFNAAGLIVPDPSFNPFPMPLSDLETEGNAWYIAPEPVR